MILVVDDEASIRETVAEILELEGYSVAVACDGGEALQLIEQQLPALVLLDMRMPVMDGWGFASAVNERGIKVPILVMTAAQSAKDWAEEVNADGYLAKPFELLDLLDSVERHRSAA